MGRGYHEPRSPAHPRPRRGPTSGGRPGGSRARGPRRQRHRSRGRSARSASSTRTTTCSSTRRRCPARPSTDPERAIEEALDGRETGIGTIVEMTPIGLGRRPGGHARGRRGHRPRPSSPPAATTATRTTPPGTGSTTRRVETLARPDRDRPDDRACTRPTGTTRRCPSTRRGPARSRAAPRTTASRAASGAVSRPSPAASAATGAAVLVHTEIGTAGHDIVDLLEAAGATTDRIALAHLDRNPDWELHAEIAARGVTLEYDTIGRTKYHPDSVVLDLIEAVVAAGHLDRHRARPRPRRARLPAGVRRRARAALPDDHVRAAPPPPARRRGRRPDPRRQPGAAVRDPGRGAAA